MRQRKTQTPKPLGTRTWKERVVKTLLESIGLKAGRTVYMKNMAFEDGARKLRRMWATSWRLYSLNDKRWKVELPTECISLKKTSLLTKKWSWNSFKSLEEGIRTSIAMFWTDGRVGDSNGMRWWRDGSKVVENPWRGKSEEELRVLADLMGMEGQGQKRKKTKKTEKKKK